MDRGRSIGHIGDPEEPHSVKRARMRGVWTGQADGKVFSGVPRVLLLREYR